MKKAVLLSVSLVLLAVSGMASSAYADSTEATCELRKDGRTKSGPCTFSQRQGYIDIDMRNGKTYSFSPGDRPDHFKDHKGHEVVRSHAGGTTQEFNWKGGTRIVVNFGGSSSSSGGADAVAVDEMPRFCAGVASAKFGVKPRDITTRAATQTKGMYEVWGQYGADAQVFICAFDSKRKFLSVDLYRP